MQQPAMCHWIWPAIDLFPLCISPSYQRPLISNLYFYFPSGSQSSSSCSHKTPSLARPTPYSWPVQTARLLLQLSHIHQSQPDKALAIGMRLGKALCWLVCSNFLYLTAESVSSKKSLALPCLLLQYDFGSSFSSLVLVFSNSSIPPHRR